FLFASAGGDVMPGTESGHYLAARTLVVNAVEGEPLEASLPRRINRGDRRNFQSPQPLPVFVDRKVILLANFDQHRDSAELDDVARVQFLLAIAESHPIDVSAVSAVKVTDPPVILDTAHFGMPTAHRVSIEDNFES